MLHDFPAATLEPQVCVWLKSPASAPEIAIPKIETALDEALVGFTVLRALDCPTGSLPNPIAAGASFTAVPTPFNGTVCGLPAALSSNRESTRVPGFLRMRE